MLKSSYFIPTINLFGAGYVNEVGGRIRLIGGKSANIYFHKCNEVILQLHLAGLASEMRC